MTISEHVYTCDYVKCERLECEEDDCRLLIQQACANRMSCMRLKRGFRILLIILDSKHYAWSNYILACKQQKENYSTVYEIMHAPIKLVWYGY